MSGYDKCTLSIDPTLLTSAVVQVAACIGIVKDSDTTEFTDFYWLVHVLNSDLNSRSSII